MANNKQIALAIPQLPIKAEDAKLFSDINAYVHEYMSKYDNSHDYNHILRVVSNANRILQAELKANSSTKYEATTLFLAALLHDVGDHKYAQPGEDIENQISTVLRKLGASDAYAIKIQTIVENVSYTNEVRNPAGVQEVLQQHPELAIVQDADRLDAIGAVGIGRCFSFGAAKMPDKPMDRAVDHFEEKLYKLASMMKTDAGKEMARKRTKLLWDFAEEWKQETSLSFELQ
ncbi:hypothetical protein ACN47E_003286 [Coniothyrium glycines]